MLGRKVQMADPDMGTWSYAYDAAGNLVRQTDARGQRVCFYYDNMNRVVGKIYWNNDSCPTPSPYTPYDVVFQYDNARGDANTANSWGRLRRAYVGSNDATNGHDYKYDDRGRTREETVWVDGTSYTTSYTYDAMDRVKTMVYPDGEVVTYGYQPNGALDTVVGSGVYVGDTTYTAWGAVEQRELGASPVLEVNYTYYPWDGGNGEGRGRLSRIRAGVPNNPTSLQDLRYFYDRVGNVETLQDYKAGSPQTQSFTYDELNRLRSAQASGGTYGHYSESYAYNAIGNLTSKGGVGYTYGTQSASCPDGALTKPHAVVAAGSKTFCYDRNGNMVKRNSGAYTLFYDAENRLRGVSGGATASFVYGPGGERVKGVVNGVTTVYIGNYYEKQGSTVRKYYYAGSTRVAMRENGILYWLLADHLGSTAVTANGTTGARVAEVRYKAWGEDRYTFGTTPTTYRYTGQRRENAIGLYFYNARWYDPALGRFTQPDTLVPSASSPQSLNRYTYVYNNPVRNIDPSGHWTLEENPAAHPSRAEMAAEKEIPHQIFSRLPTNTQTIRLNQGFGNTKYAYDNKETQYALLGRLHSGLDLSMGAGADVYAMCPGTVVGIDQNIGKGGKSVVIEYGGYRVVYGHVIAGVEVGQKVAAGDVIGTIQDQGDNSHLHLEVRQSRNHDIFFNPLYLFDPEVAGNVTGLGEQQYINPATGKVDSHYNVWSMGAYNRGNSGNFWDDNGGVTVTWGNPFPFR